MPKVSVIVPNYNHAPFLNQRLDSIFNQTFQDFEVILLDDASTDNSLSNLEDYKEKFKLKVSHLIVNEKNSGSPFKQWKKGIELARGEYVWIAESDDWADTDFLNQTVATLECKKGKECGLAFVNSYSASTTGEFKIKNKNKFAYLKKRALVSPYFGNQQFIEDHMTAHIVITNASAVIFRRRFLHEVDQKVFDYRQMGDSFFWLEIIMRSGGVCFINENLNYHRIHSSSLTHINKREKIYVIKKEKLAYLKKIEVYATISKNYRLKHLASKYAFKTVKADIRKTLSGNLKSGAIVLSGIRNFPLILKEFTRLRISNLKA